MVYSFDGFNYLIRLDKGERLAESLQKFIAQVDCKGAWLSGIGGAQEATLGFYNLDSQQYSWQTFKDLYEVTNLNGTIAVDENNKPVFHLHCTLADSSYKAIGGHLKDLVAGGTVEIFVHRAYKPIRRKTDPAVGLQTLDLS